MELIKRYLLDTNAIIYLLGGRLASALPNGQYGISVITEIELLSFPHLSAEEEQKIRDLIFLFDRMQLTDAIRDEAIRIRRNNRVKLPDAIIAASAIANQATLLTNDQAFSSISELTTESLSLN